MLDEPTLGLDLLYRKAFYDSLLNDYFDHSRTIIVTTHQVEEIEHILTDVMFINRGRIVLSTPMENLETRYAEVMTRPELPRVIQASQLLLQPYQPRKYPTATSQGLGSSDNRSPLPCFAWSEFHLSLD